MPMDSESSERRVAATLRAAAERLGEIPDGAPGLEAEILLSEATGWTRSKLLAWPDLSISQSDAVAFDRLLGRRLAGEPIAYIRGHQAFWTLDLRVSPATLIPRPETELLVETALEQLDGARPLDVADLGTGSGAIAAAVASERPDWHIIATEHCAAALDIATANFRSLGLASIRSLRADWLAPFADSSLDAILSNPPYIRAADPHLARGDLRFEPSTALSPGGDGLRAIRAILRGAMRCLRVDGLLMVEHGHDQGAQVRQLFAEQALRGIATLRDLAGLERVTLARR